MLASAANDDPRQLHVRELLHYNMQVYHNSVLRIFKGFAVEA